MQEQWYFQKFQMCSKMEKLIHHGDSTRHLQYYLLEQINVSTYPEPAVDTYSLVVEVHVRIPVSTEWGKWPQWHAATEIFPIKPVRMQQFVAELG